LVSAFQGGGTLINKVIRSKRMKWTGHVTRMRKMRNAYKILVKKFEGNTRLGRPGSRWEHDIRTALGEIG